MITSACSLVVGAIALYLRARGRMRWGILMFGAIGFSVSFMALKSNLLNPPPVEPCEGQLVRIGRNPDRYVGLANGEKRYYVLEGDTLKTITAAEACAK